VQRRISALRSHNSATNCDTARFFEFLLSEVDADEYSLIQEHYRASPDGTTKYLDPITWFESKLRTARRLGLDKSPSLKILDLGTGPGHFPVVARYYGHDVTGTDLPGVSGGVDNTGHLYDSLCGIYRVKRISHVVRPNQPLTGLGDRYDMVTAFLAAFNVDAEKKPWTRQHWEFFLKDLGNNVTTDRGTVFLVLDNKKLTDESWSYLSSLAEWAECRSKQVLISNLRGLE
jgi:hypothetical protein